MCSKFPSIWLEVKREFDSNILIKRFYREWNFFFYTGAKICDCARGCQPGCIKIERPKLQMLEECGLINMNLSV